MFSNKQTGVKHDAGLMHVNGRQVDRDEPSTGRTLRLHLDDAHRPARCVADITGHSTTGYDTRLRVCELGLACFGLLRHNSMATWRQLLGCTTTKPVVLFIGRLRSYTPPDGIRSEIRVIRPVPSVGSLGAYFGRFIGTPEY